ncbi:ABC transporter substrate-binding protein [Nocardia alni]|uniref:ABC transporter substrate-binding protein n=1 Tax=Nocardia alni TaxID=2815723 RepID=UPI001C212921|nr:ABC transporter substrate-binding protein [Nocardia alni]
MAGLALFAVAGCGAGRTNAGGAGTGLVLGTTDKIFSIDPAGSYDAGSSMVEAQIYQQVLNYAPGEATPKPDAAQQCSFTGPTVYTCTLRPGLKFTNGDPLTAASVKFSFDRVQKIADPNGPVSLLGNLDHTDAPNPTTVAFILKHPDDQTFSEILATPAGHIVDEKVFPADKVLDDDAVVKGKGFSGPYGITSYDKNKLVEYQANPAYNGILGTPKTATVSEKYYASSDNLKLDIQNGNIDVAYRTLSPTDLDSLRKDDKVTVHEGPGGELRYIVFNMNTMPGGTPEQKLAVRKAVASSIDRDALSREVYKGLYTSAYSFVPQGYAGAIKPYADIYGAGPNKAEAARYLSDAGVQTPVQIDLQYNPDHYGASGSEEYAAIKNQLESTGMFRVNLQSTEWVTYNKERAKDAYPVYQLGWYPDYPDADDYLLPLVGPDNFLQSHFQDPGIDAQLVAEETEPDKAKRIALLEQLQRDLADKFVPIVPLLSGRSVAVAAKGVHGVDSTLDLADEFRFSVLSK